MTSNPKRHRAAQADHEVLESIHEIFAEFRRSSVRSEMNYRALPTDDRSPQEQRERAIQSLTEVETFLNRLSILLDHGLVDDLVPETQLPYTLVRLRRALQHRNATPGRMPQLFASDQQLTDDRKHYKDARNWARYLIQANAAAILCHQAANSTASLKSLAQEIAQTLVKSEFADQLKCSTVLKWRQRCLREEHDQTKLFQLRVKGMERHEIRWDDALADLSSLCKTVLIGYEG